ncbi:uncharacterized protein LOC124457139 [Xenia sp. Carnegie-2017]|uniref:uncharacterized protein LOC124457139 n=1 Tax=Xenia sp. Carnegie-2017 TaxID=2897299 RepID=UPI001F03FC6E|nr:uncharacterized protein LOC124457139 [Xenia sp. Carnegie-2017]
MSSSVFDERRSFETTRKKLDGVHFKKNIRLNVGGQVFKTSIETLLKDPDSMLAAMFSERFNVKPDEEDGAYFIDRDGTHFRYILNYLRTGKLIYPKTNKILAKELYLEAEFYQINGLKREIWPGVSFLGSSFIIHSLTDEQKCALLSWLPEYDVLLDWVQLFSNVKNGWSSSEFHRTCDNKGPTVVLAKAGDYIFGAYASSSWVSVCNNAFVKDESSFLFNLSNPNGAPPTKLSNANNDWGMWMYSSCGPLFGSHSSCSILFMNSSNSSICCVTNGIGEFNIPCGQTLSAVLAGATSTISMNNLEVFGLSNI